MTDGDPSRRVACPCPFGPRETRCDDEDDED